ncbi:MAG: hypothetical protein SF051_02030, partial [Elusimicrobiota bacterium]|nr:hypothetical protein [Elusimicrobiota bacterium]
MRRASVFLALVLSAAPLRADDSVYAGDDNYARLRQLLTPLELAILPGREGVTWEHMADPSKQAVYHAAHAAALAALDASPPDYQRGVAEVATLRAEVLEPTIRAYLSSSEEAARGDAPLTAFETGALSSYLLFWHPAPRAADAPLPPARDGRA